MGYRQAALTLAAVASLGAAAPPSEVGANSGFLCDWAMMLAIDEFSRRCEPDVDRPFAQALGDGLVRMRAHATGKGQMPAEAADRFERQMRDADNPKICAGDGGMLASAFRAAGAKELRALVYASIAKPPPLKFGACL